MGEGSIFLRWLPPRMDLMSRSNNVPVIGYEISINGLRRAQVSGAYTNQAVVGNLKLEKNTSVEIRTVSSTGMVSDAVHVDLMRSNVASQISSSSSSSKSSIKKNNTKATVLYDYNPQEDSPYTHQEQEIKLKQGQVVRVLSQERHDGFCRVKINKVHGWAPAAFLMMEPNSTAHRWFHHKNQILTKFTSIILLLSPPHPLLMQFSFIFALVYSCCWYELFLRTFDKHFL